MAYDIITILWLLTINVSKHESPLCVSVHSFTAETLQYDATLSARTDGMWFGPTTHTHEKQSIWPANISIVLLLLQHHFSSNQHPCLSTLAWGNP